MDESRFNPSAYFVFLIFCIRTTWNAHTWKSSLFQKIVKSWNFIPFYDNILLSFKYFCKLLLHWDERKSRILISNFFSLLKFSFKNFTIEHDCCNQPLNILRLFDVSPQVKGWAIITYKDGIYDLPQELQNDLTLKILGNREISGKCLNYTKC